MLPFYIIHILYYTYYNIQIYYYNKISFCVRIRLNINHIVYDKLKLEEKCKCYEYKCTLDTVYIKIYKELSNLTF